MPLDQRPRSLRDVDQEIGDLVRVEQMRMIFEQTLVASLTATAFAIFMALHMRPDVPDAAVLGWIAAKIASVAPRVVQARRFKRRRVTDMTWMRRGRALLLLDGLVWGAAGVVLMPTGDVTGMAVLVATLCGVCAVASFVLHADWWACTAYTVPILLPPAAWLLLSGLGSFGWYGAGSALTFLTLLLVAARRSERHIIEMLILRFNTDRITARLATALQVSRDESRVKTEFLANMSHELRTPLHGILGLSRLLIKASPQGRDVDSLELIRRSGEHLLGLINGILDYSRVENKGLTLEPEDVDIAQLVEDSASLCQSNAMEKNLRLTCVVDLPRPCMVKADPSRVRQVLLNLIGNAVKFTDQGAVHVKAIEVDGGKSILVRIEDSGEGIAAAEIDRIFEPFVQADNSSRRRHGGTGLGLSISRRICRAMGGDITCTSVPGQGSTFVATFGVDRQMPPTLDLWQPRHALAARHADGADRHAPEIERPPLRLTGRVLLAEDNEVNAIVATAILEQFGVLVERARNGLEAMAQACVPGDRPDLVLMDCQMPEMDGYDAAQRIRDHERLHGLPRLPIVALTANALLHDRDRCLAAGMDTYLAKPFAEADLQAVLVAHLSPPRSSLPTTRDLGLDSDFHTTSWP